MCWPEKFVSAMADFLVFWLSCIECKKVLLLMNVPLLTNISVWFTVWNMRIEGKDSSVNATLQWSVKSEQIASNWVFYVSFNVTINRCAATAHFPEKDMKSIHWAEFSSSYIYEESFMLDYWSNIPS